ncbi:MAG: ACP S-malonyltransferase [Planctomycetota bacterium]|jgi:[acyl-carrier-protein] S-malonyltransferase
MVGVAKRAFLFPGQGAQHVGMGKDFFDEFEVARDIYHRANDVLGLDLAQICFSGEETELSKTLISQPAILVTSVAMLEVFRSLKGADATACHAACGHSLGEYTALVFAGAIGLEDAIRIVHKRGRYMHEATEGTASGMAAILGLADDDVDDICREASAHGVICAANYNCPGQVVISGENKALEAAARLVHSPLVAPAQANMKAELEGLSVVKAGVPVVANVSAEYVVEPEEIKNALVAQITSPVRWTQSMERLIGDGIDEFYEVGPGKVLSGLLRRIDRSKQANSVDTVDTLNAVLSQ